MALLEEHPPTPAHQAASHPAQISMRDELLRKMIHLSSISIPITYIFVPRSTLLWIFGPLTAIGLVIEMLRTRVPAVEELVRKLFGSMLRSHEKASGKGKISGATWVILSAFLCILFFPRVITIAGFAVLIVSDTASALIGRRYGRHRFLEKSVEGSSAFVVTAIIVVLVVAGVYDAPWQFVVAGVVASFAAAVAEAMSYGVNVDDNLTIPLAFGAVCWGMLLLMPADAVTGLLRL